MQLQLLEALQAQLHAAAARDLVFDENTPGIGERCASLLDLLQVAALRLSHPVVSALSTAGNPADIASFAVSGVMDVLGASGLGVTWTFFVAHDARAPSADAIHYFIEPEN